MSTKQISNLLFGVAVLMVTSSCYVGDAGKIVFELDLSSCPNTEFLFPKKIVDNSFDWNIDECQSYPPCEMFKSYIMTRPKILGIFDSSDRKGITVKIVGDKSCKLIIASIFTFRRGSTSPCQNLDSDTCKVIIKEARNTINIFVPLLLKEQVFSAKSPISLHSVLFDMTAIKKYCESKF